MPSKALLHEAQQLHDISQRLELLADQHPNIAVSLLSICGTIRGSAAILEVLVTTKLDSSEPA